MVILFITVALVYSVIMYFFRKKLIRLAQENKQSNELLKIKYYRFIEIQEEHYRTVELFNSSTKNKVYELALILVHIKQHYENMLEVIDEYLEPEIVGELKKSIEDVDNQLKEIGFINNKEKVCLSAIKDIYNIKNSDFSKN